MDVNIVAAIGVVLRGISILTLIYLAIIQANIVRVAKDALTRLRWHMLVQLIIVIPLLFIAAQASWRNLYRDTTPENDRASLAISAFIFIYAENKVAIYRYTSRRIKRGEV